MRKVFYGLIPLFAAALAAGLVVSDRLCHVRRSLACARILGHASPFALAHEGSD